MRKEENEKDVCSFVEKRDLHGYILLYILLLLKTPSL